MDHYNKMADHEENFPDFQYNSGHLNKELLSSSCNGTSSHHLTSIGRGAVKLTAPYAANDEEAISLFNLSRDGFSTFTAKIPAF